MKNEKSVLKIIFAAAAVTAAVVVLSSVSAELWGGKPETPPPDRQVVLETDMTLEDFAGANGLSSESVKKIFNTPSDADLRKKIAEFNMPAEEIAAKAAKAFALEHEEASKDWIKILVKFILWAAFLTVVYVFLKKRKIDPARRKIFLGLGVLIFGVALGADPSPMGTIKDAVILFGHSRAIFPPRFVAFVIMIAGGTMIANKFLCSWGCQFGTLQDLLFRFNRNKADSKGLLKQYKIPFAVSNAIRILTFAALVGAAVLWGTDIIDPVDPFKIFKPLMLSAVGIVFIAALLLASVFVYRPWCHLFCPFGLVGWLAEKGSLKKIQVDYAACTACGACEKACPSTVMGAILKRDRVIPDCFACGTCVEVCPVKAIEFKGGKRRRPPEGKFEK